MSASRTELFAHLDGLGIRHETVSHRPVFTVEEGRDIKAALPGGHTKNLFLKDRKGQVFLVTALAETEIRLNRLHRPLGSARLSFGPEALLLDTLGVQPGSVTALALLNDTGGRVRFVLDAALLEWPVVYSHPLLNDATTGIAPADLVRFAESTGHPPRLIDFTLLLDDEDATQ
ncbi:prolyl-tRNA synthetase associated domain-containing protein [uncultured Maricaulis sp.]|uniref:prolyl-tRNA synthetase associated domain-containing protein n=1 Tax=uncultured Maricaulis sp. TaxID=174710 RepID=UPI0030D84EE0|tara:strand:- start:105262 stop:105783 length:522 start_codon:yes stop_codon:yes gene_type:complete